MIIRIVKLTILPDKTADFIILFKESRPFILDFEGCSYVELLKDSQKTNLFFTYSCWDSENHLNDYRHSEFFKNTWSRTKILFEEKAEAWSLLPST
ncbi:MAG TPA: antibiotic biosynthesis monooxygenase family protein [Bacteroidia bacterium]|nr:antibiotic biosynthesis monooxygenase family protein [Bacteroidia bacterium]